MASDNSAIEGGPDVTRLTNELKTVFVLNVLDHVISSKEVRGVPPHDQLLCCVVVAELAFGAEHVADHASHTFHHTFQGPRQPQADDGVHEGSELWVRLCLAVERLEQDAIVRHTFALSQLPHHTICHHDAFDWDVCRRWETATTSQTDDRGL